MSISSISQGSRPPSLQETLSTSLQSKGLSADQASAIGSELESVAQSTMSSSSGKADPSSVRAALEEQLSKDVESGTLTSDEADQVRSALNDFEAQMKANRPAGPPPGGAGGPPPGEGGEVQESDNDEDDSSQSALEQLLESLQNTSQGTSTSKTQDYLSQLMTSGLVDIKA